MRHNEHHWSETLCKDLPNKNGSTQTRQTTNNRTKQTTLNALYRERKMRTNFFCTNFLSTPRGPGHPGKILGTSQIPLFETQGRKTFEGEHELFGHNPFAWKTPTPPGGLRTQKVNLCALFSCLTVGRQIPKPTTHNIGPITGQNKTG